MTGRGRNRGVFRVPTLLALVGVVGLVSALIGDGPWDALSWAALATPVLVIIRCLWRSRASRLRIR
jgi:hypothetical protein